jgi:hypothetical protein
MIFIFEIENRYRGVTFVLVPFRERIIPHCLLLAARQLFPDKSVQFLWLLLTTETFPADSATTPSRIQMSARVRHITMVGQAHDVMILSPRTSETISAVIC